MAPLKAKQFLKSLKSTGVRVELITCGGEMGEDKAHNVSIPHNVVWRPRAESNAEDTIQAALLMKSQGIPLLVFVGGDGTARDICSAVGDDIVVLGVPSGVKTYSSVFAVNPTAAAEIAADYLIGELSTSCAEVLDIDEEEFRQGRLRVRLFGYMTTPCETSLMQASKESSPETEDEKASQMAIAKHVVEEMRSGVAYVIGPGTTTKSIADELGIEKTLLGVDIVLDGKVLAKDVGESEILRTIGDREVRVVVTPIGRQGFIFGRGNQQITPLIIRRAGRENVLVVATRTKLRNLEALRVDTGDASLDDELRGFVKVVVDYREEVLTRCI